jgi:hypothetical protein
MTIADLCNSHGPAGFHDSGTWQPYVQRYVYNRETLVSSGLNFLLNFSSPSYLLLESWAHKLSICESISTLAINDLILLYIYYVSDSKPKIPLNLTTRKQVSFFALLEGTEPREPGWIANGHSHRAAKLNANMPLLILESVVSPLQGCLTGKSEHPGSCFSAWALTLVLCKMNSQNELRLVNILQLSELEIWLGSPQ